jgi:hypothetical protein
LQRWISLPSPPSRSSCSTASLLLAMTDGRFCISTSLDTRPALGLRSSYGKRFLTHQLPDSSSSITIRNAGGKFLPPCALCASLACKPRSRARGITGTNEPHSDASKGDLRFTAAGRNLQQIVQKVLEGREALSLFRFPTRILSLEIAKMSLLPCNLELWRITHSMLPRLSPCQR